MDGRREGQLSQPMVITKQEYTKVNMLTFEELRILVSLQIFTKAPTRVKIDSSF